MLKNGTILLMLMGWLYGCNQNRAQKTTDALQHDDPGIQYTLFSDNIEFFIEHEPLEAGKESGFLVHLTDLSTYKPYRSGSITIQIDGVSATSDPPSNPGIFKVLFTPQKPGTFQAEYTYQSESVTESVPGHIHIEGDHEEQHGKEQAGHGHSHTSDAEGDIIFLKEQAWNNDFMVSAIDPVTFAPVIPTSGEIIAVPGKKKSVAAHHQGMVHFSNENLVQGSQVSNGQLLFTISTEKMIDNNVKLKYQESLNRFEKSRSEYSRHKKLYGQGAISERQLITSRASYTEDSLRFHSIDSNTSEEGFRVNAPVSGTIHELNVTEGEYVTTGQLMATISSNQILLIRADLSQQFYDQLKEIETANFRPAYTDRVYSIEEMRGRLLAAGTSVAENDHYLPVIFELENDGRLLEGAYTEVFLKTKGKKKAMVVPVKAIIEEMGEHFVYIQVTGESYAKRPVSTGSNDGRFMEIIRGIQPGERVVTRGVMLVKATSLVTGTMDHGHTH